MPWLCRPPNDDRPGLLKGTDIYTDIYNCFYIYTLHIMAFQALSVRQHGPEKLRDVSGTDVALLRSKAGH